MSDLSSYVAVKAPNIKEQYDVEDVEDWELSYLDIHEDNNK